MSLKRPKQDPKQRRFLLGKPNCPVTAAVSENLPHHLQSLLLAVSGGVDSMVLLHACAALAKLRKISLSVAHVDHKLRNSSSVDASFVCVQANIASLPVRLYEAKQTPSANIEEWGRNIRYGFFNSIVCGLNLDGVATAHTASDDVELFLMQLFSNKTLAPMAFFEPRRKIYRPLLSVTRKQIEDYAKQHSINWVEDESNKSDRYLRNRVRNRLVPLLNNIFDGNVEKTLREQIVRLSDMQAAAKEGLINQVGLTTQISFGSKAWMNLVREQIRNLVGHSLRVYTEELFYPQIKRRLGDRWPERLKAFILGNSAQMQLPGNLTIRRRHGGIELTQSNRPTKL